MSGNEQSQEVETSWLQSRLLPALAYLLCAGYLLFAHGCHGGDADTELSTSITVESSSAAAAR